MNLSLRFLLFVSILTFFAQASLFDWWNGYMPGPLMETLEDRPALLEINDDVLLEICDAVKATALDGHGQTSSDQKSFKSLSQTNRYLREVMTPDLFKSVRIGIDWDWDKALDAVKSIEKCEAVKDHTERFFR